MSSRSRTRRRRWPLEFEPALLLNGDLLNCVHLTFELGNFVFCFGPALDEKQCWPKQYQSYAHYYRIIVGLVLLDAHYSEAI